MTKMILASSASATRSVLAWHFLADKKLAHGDGRRVRTGGTLSVEPPIKVCANGLHGSINIRDALRHAPGSTLCRTLHSGNIAECDDKIASQHRKVLWMGDISDLLHEFACREAERAIAVSRSEGIPIDSRCDAAIAATRAWLKTKISSQELRDAESAAWSAAWAAAWSAAGAAAWSAARSAAESAARAAAWSAAWSDQNERLTAMIFEHMAKNGYTESQS